MFSSCFGKNKNKDKSGDVRDGVSTNWSPVKNGNYDDRDIFNAQNDSADIDNGININIISSSPDSERRFQQRSDFPITSSETPQNRPIYPFTSNTMSRVDLNDRRREFFRDLYQNVPQKSEFTTRENTVSTLPTIVRARQFGDVRSMRPVSQPILNNSHLSETPPPGPHLLRSSPESRSPSRLASDTREASCGFASNDFLEELREAAAGISVRWALAEEERLLRESIKIAEAEAIEKNQISQEQGVFVENQITETDLLLLEENQIIETDLPIEENLVSRTDLPIKENFVIESNLTSEGILVPETNVPTEENLVPETNVSTEGNLLPETNFSSEENLVPEKDLPTEDNQIPERDLPIEENQVPQRDLIQEEIQIVPETDFIVNCMYSTHFNTPTLPLNFDSDFLSNQKHSLQSNESMSETMTRTHYSFQSQTILNVDSKNAKNDLHKINGETPKDNDFIQSTNAMKYIKDTFLKPIRCEDDILKDLSQIEACAFFKKGSVDIYDENLPEIIIEPSSDSEMEDDVITAEDYEIDIGSLSPRYTYTVEISPSEEDEEDEVTEPMDLLEMIERMSSEDDLSLSSDSSSGVLSSS